MMAPAGLGGGKLAAGREPGEGSAASWHGRMGQRVPTAIGTVAAVPREQPRRGEGWTCHPDASKPRGEGDQQPLLRQGKKQGAGGRGMPEGQEGISHPALGQHLWVLRPPHAPLTRLPLAPGHGGAVPPVPGSPKTSQSLPGGPAQPLQGSHTAGKFFWGLATIPPRSQERAPCLPPTAQRLRPESPCSLPVPARPVEGPPGQSRGVRAGFEICQLRLCWERTPPSPEGGLCLGGLAQPAPELQSPWFFPLNQRASRGTANTHEPSAGQKDAAGGRKRPN